MSNDRKYVLLVPDSESRFAGHRRTPLLRTLLTLSMLCLFAFSGFLTWRWAEKNIFHWGIDDGRTTRVDGAQLLDRLKVFQVVSVKDTYAANTRVDVEKVLSAGPTHVDLPGWIAGQNMKASARMSVSAGVDLGQLKADDIQVERRGHDTHVIINLPGPQILSTELVPNSMDIDTGQGVLTRLKTRLGFSEKDLRDGAMDGLVRSAQKEAEATGILDEAGKQVQQRLEGFLASLPREPNANLDYEVRLRARPLG
jgi:uncharacterized protein DUF4230